MVDLCVKMTDYVILVSVDDVFLDGVSKEGVLVFLAYKLLQSSNLYQGLRRPPENMPCHETQNSKNC